MKTIPIQKTTTDLATGVSTRQNSAALLMPCPPEACQTCGQNPAHPADQPHNADSLYYQYAFFGEHHRWPTWVDAVAHCPEPVRTAWEKALRTAGVWPV